MGATRYPSCISLSLVPPTGLHSSSSRCELSSNDYLKDNHVEGKLGQRSCYQKKCSKYYCVPIMKSVLATLTTSSAATLCVFLLLSAHLASGEISGVRTAAEGERGVYVPTRHHHQYPRARPHNSNSHHQLHSGSGHFRGLDEEADKREPHHHPRVAEPTGLDKVLERLDRRNRSMNEVKVGEQQQNRTSLADRKSLEDGGQEKGEEENGHYHRQSAALLPRFPSTTTATATPRGHHHPHVDEPDQDEDEDYDEDEDDDDEYDEEDEPQTQHKEKTSQYSAENNKSAYQSERRMAGMIEPFDTSSSTTPSPMTSSSSPAPFSHSQWKWQHLGTREGLQKFRRQKLLEQQGSSNPSPRPSYPNGNRLPQFTQFQGLISSSQDNLENAAKSQQLMIEDAISHAKRVRNEAVCKTPRPRVVNIQHRYPSPNKIYNPHCTILHECAEDTGCCHEPETCMPKNVERVELTFFSTFADQSRESIVERLVFYNHTECECRDKSEEEMPRDESYLGHQYRHNSDYAASSTTNAVKVDDRDKRKDSLCKCPSAFNRKLMTGGGCSCDCFEDQMDCIHLKHGRDVFSVSDKRCIQTGRCEIPECAFGRYIHVQGRCPHRREDSSSWTKYLAP